MNILLKPKPRTLRQMLIWAVLTPLWICAMGLAGIYGTTALVNSGVIPQIAVYPERDVAPPPRPIPESARLVEEHDCWNREAPAEMVGKIATHSVLTVNGRTGYYGNYWTSRALDQLFAGKPYGITVHGFCPEGAVDNPWEGP